MLVKYLKADGTGDYTNLTTAFSDMLVSGLSSSGDIIDYRLISDGNSYSGVISGYIPYSGEFYIIGNGSIFNLNQSISTSGEYYNQVTPNLYIQNCTLYCSGLSSNVVNIVSGYGVKLSDVQFLLANSGISNSGLLIIDNVNSNGISGYSSYFLNSSNGYNFISNLNVSNYNKAIIGNNLYIDNCNIFNNRSGIYYTNSYDILIQNTLLNNIYSDIYLGSGNLNLSYSTIVKNIIVNSGYVYGNSDIFVNGNISGICITGYLTNCNFNDTIATNLSGSNNINEINLFNNINYNDYRLIFAQTVGSKCIEVKDNSNYSDDIKVNIDNSKLQIYDSQGKVTNLFLPFIYVQDSSLVVTDLNNEIQFSELKNNYKNLYYEFYNDIIFDLYNIKTESCFSRNEDFDKYPYDWDILNLKTTEIKEYNDYLISRSYIDIESLIKTKVYTIPGTLSFSNINKNNIKVYNIRDQRGIAYDYYLSSPGKNILWILDGKNQTLIQKNLYSEEIYNSYPLLCSESKILIKPSGLIYTTPYKDYYKYIVESDPNIEIFSETDNGYFKWICTEINNYVDLRGLTIYDDQLLLTGSKYSNSISDRTIVPTGVCNGFLLWVYNNDTYLNYIKDFSKHNYSLLTSGNFYPTDLTIYEDGSIFIADYISNSGIYRYKFVYDYALKNITYDNNTRILLREEYNDVDLR